MQGTRRVETGREAGNDVVGVEVRTVVEDNALSEGAGPHGALLIRRTFCCQLWLDSSVRFVSVQCLDDLCAGAQRLAVGLVRTVERNRLVALGEHHRVCAVVPEVEQDLTPCRCVRTLNRGEGAERARRVGNGDHRHELLDCIVRFFVRWSLHGWVCRCRRRQKRFVDLRIRIAELENGGSKVWVEEVRDVRIVARPSEKVNSVTFSDIRALLDELARLENYDLGIDVQVLQELRLDVCRNVARRRQVAASDVPIVNRGREAVRKTGSRQECLCSFDVEVVPAFTFTPEFD